MTITDSHCHLDFPQFEGQHEAIIARAIEAGVTRMLTIATTSAGLEKVRAISASHDAVYHAFGIHPLHVHEEPIIALERLLEATGDPGMIGIGETGLDYHYSTRTIEAQKESLEVHIRAAQESGLPLIIHSRDADEDMGNCLRARYRERKFSCVMHCFSSGEALARIALDCGFYLSMSGVVTFKNSEPLREIFRRAPLKRILVETDAPYLAPTPYRGKRNEPSLVVETAKIGAELFELEYDAFAKATEENFDRLFPRAAKTGAPK